MTTSTASWLSSHDWVDAALVLLIEGLDLSFTNNEDTTGLSSAWNTATSGAWTTVKGGLTVSGAIQRSAEIFAAQVRPSSLTFGVLDADDVLLPLMFGEARSSIVRTDLSTSIDSSTATVTTLSYEPTLTSGATDLFIGTETFHATSQFAIILNGVRGYRSIGGTSADSSHFGRPHEVNAATGDRPEITNSPTAFYNRGVALFLCHRVNGVWSAGFPGSAATDAELLWTGRIKSWSEDGEGTISMDCMEITERIQTSLLSRQYTGHLNNGKTVDFNDTILGIKVEVAGYDTATTTPELVTTQAYPFTEFTWVGEAETITLDDIVSRINALLAEIFAGATTGDFGPTDISVYISGPDVNGRYALGTAWPGASTPVGTADYFTSSVSLYMHDSLWALLGFGDQLTYTNPFRADHRAVNIQFESAFSAEVPRQVVASNPPGTRVISDNGMMTIIPDSALSSFVPFLPQTRVPESIASNTGTSRGEVDGFFMIGDSILVAVQQLSENEFQLKSGGIVAPLGSGIPSVVNGDLSPFFGSQGDVQSLMHQNVTTNVPVRQVWLETGAMGDIFLKLLASTGTAAYNHADHDYFPAWMGAGIPWTLLNPDSILGLDDSAYTLLITKPVSLAKLLESALQFTGKQLVFVDGQITVITTTNGTNGGTLVALTESNKAKVIHTGGEEISDRTMCVRSPAGILNRITLKHNADLGGEFQRTITVNATTSQSDYDQVKSVVVDGFGIYQDNAILSDSSLVSWEREMVATALAEFSRPVAIATRSYDFSLATKLYPGTRVSLTDDALIDPATGIRGVSALLGWCMSATFDWATGVGKTDIVFQPSRASARSNSLGPSAESDVSQSSGGFLDGYSASTKTLEVLHDEFSASGGQDLANFTVGDVVHIVELDPSNSAVPQEWTTTITGIDLVLDRVTLQDGLTGWASSSAAPTLTVLDKGFFTGGGTVKTTASVTTAAGGLLMVIEQQGSGTSTTALPTITGQGLSWTQVDSITSGNDKLSLYSSVVTVGATSTFTITFDNNVGAMKFQLIQIANANTSQLIEQHANNTAAVTFGPFAFTLAAATSSRSILFAVETSALANNITGQLSIDGSLDPGPWTPLNSGAIGGLAPGFSSHTIDSNGGTRNSITYTFGSSQSGGIYYGFLLEIKPQALGRRFVMEYAPIGSSTSSQRGKAAYIADAISRSTGFAAKDAFVWGGDVDNVSDPFQGTQAYCRANLFNDDVGTALSVHKLLKLSDWANTAYCFHLSPIYANELFPGGLVIPTSSAVYSTVWGPVWVPIYSARRRIEFRALMTSVSGLSFTSVRLVTSSKLPRGGTSFANPVTTSTYADANLTLASAPSWVLTPTVMAAGTNVYVTGTIENPSTTVRDGVRGTYLTLDITSAGNNAKLWSLYIGQLQEAL